MRKKKRMIPFFSFIVPCCDIESYVEECIHSILKQSFQDWECILGIEASNDRTEEIIREKAFGDPRFRVFTGPRTGSCSATRNTGIDLARGEYIIFLDGDDTIADDCLKRLHEKICANPDADLYPCVILTNNEITGNNEYRDNYRQDAPVEMTGNEALFYMDRHFQGSFNPMLQQTIHSRKFLLKHDLKCINGLRHQDAEFSPRELYLAKRVVPLHEPYYIYRIRPNSVQAKSNGKDADYFMKDWAIVTKSLLAFYDKVSRVDGFDERVVPCWINQWFNRIRSKWFSTNSIRTIPRRKRAEWLEFIFKDGFDIYNRMLEYGSFRQKIDAFHVRIFVRHPALRWYSELFFQTVQQARRCFHKLFRRKSAKMEQLYIPIPPARQ